jgi:hypothetical protein
MGAEKRLVEGEGLTTKNAATKRGVQGVDGEKSGEGVDDRTEHFVGSFGNFYA